MNTDILRARLNELMGVRKQFEVQLFTINGHVDEVQYLINQIENPQPVPVPPTPESNDGQADSQATQQAA